MQTKERKIDQEPIGLIAGGGNIPSLLAAHLCSQGIEIYFVNITGTVADTSIQAQQKLDSSYTEIGKILNFFNANQIKKLVFCGYIERIKNLSQLKTDFEGAKLLASIGSKAIMGDNNILLAVKIFLEKRGFELLSLNQLMPELVAKKSILTIVSPDGGMKETIKIGVEFLHHISSFDVGQAVIAEDKRIIAVEGAEGTDKMIERAGQLVGGNGVLIKIPKQGQIKEIDLPAIGMDTIENIAKNNIKGICIKAGETLIIDQEKVIAAANRLGLFIQAI